MPGYPRRQPTQGSLDLAAFSHVAFPKAVFCRPHKCAMKGLRHAARIASGESGGGNRPSKSIREPRHEFRDERPPRQGGDRRRAVSPPLPSPSPPRVGGGIFFFLWAVCCRAPTRRVRL